MLFNSHVFLFAFLPVVIYFFFRSGTLGHHRVAIAWLVGASLFFYAWWNPVYLGLILGSILFNYAVGTLLTSRKNGHSHAKRSILITGIVANLALLGYFKYANFFLDNLNFLVDGQYQIGHVVLPLAISFFTFQQIAYLVDAFRGETREYNFLHYCLFVTFFPQLIAGPIVHHREMLAQFGKDSIYRFSHSDFAVGMTILILGLFKKVVLADGVSVYVAPVFDAARNGAVISFTDGWAASLAYTFQIYFDFSGYSDMAIGLGRLFGIYLPLNFNSPYKAENIIEFWRRWHITLSRFLRDYLYFPLGGNRRGPIRRYVNLMTVMWIGGLWHGAGWTFVAWGGLHGMYLVINHLYKDLYSKNSDGIKAILSSAWHRYVGVVITFLSVVVAWVFFRAADFSSAEAILKGMIGFNHYPLSPYYIDKLEPIVKSSFAQIIFWRLTPLQILFMSLIPLLMIVWFTPNTQQILCLHKPALDYEVNDIDSGTLLKWQPTIFWAICIAILGLVSVLKLSGVTEFLYFQF